MNIRIFKTIDNIFDKIIDTLLIEKIFGPKARDQFKNFIVQIFLTMTGGKNMMGKFADAE